MKRAGWLDAILSTLRSIARDRSLRSATFSFLLTRIFIFVIFIFVIHVSVLFPERVFRRDPEEVRIWMHRSSIARRLRPLATGAGSGWYLDIATNGYEHKPFDVTHEHNWAFLPLFPLVWRLAAKITGGYLLTGMAISNLFFFFALLLLHKTVLAFGYEEAVADRVLFYTAAFPTSYFFSMPLSESLFLLLSVASFYAAKRGVWWVAALMGALASATRVTGMLLLPALLLLHWRAGNRFKFESRMLLLLLIPAGLVAFMVYLHFVTGNAFAFADVQHAWGRSTGFFMRPLWNYITDPLNLSDQWDFRILNFACAALTFVCGFVLMKWREWSFAFYTFASVIVPLSSLALQSLGRYTMVVFPVFIVLAVAGRRPRVDQTIRAIFIGLLGIMSALFAAIVTLALS
ncbi:MAG TPA: mannosyltransferase family protein [Pyrinomonadaceae bacterium]|nr:mannosyltransferase family protein [Pyrinomonadaceae bacterium]